MNESLSLALDKQEGVGEESSILSAMGNTSAHKRACSECRKPVKILVQWLRSQVVRRRSAKPLYVGSTPTGASHPALFSNAATVAEENLTDCDIRRVCEAQALWYDARRSPVR
jgi:hypothetical protein